MAPGFGADVGLEASLSGLLALAGLSLLPGLLVVRAPFSAVPFLSLSFWALSWGWLPGASRQRFLHAALLGFLPLLLLRLLKPLGLGAPRKSALFVLAAAALPMLAFLSWPLLPGVEMSFHSLGARLLVWRDGLPLSYEPLVSLRPFGLHTPVLPALAADVSLLSGLAPAKAVLLVHQAAAGLLIVALHALFARRLEPPRAALAAVLTVALARVPASFAVFGDGGPLLALAFAAAAAAWLGPKGSRSGTVAAGTFLGTAALAQPVLTLGAVAALGLRLRPWRDRAGRARFALAVGLAVGLAAPLLLRLAGAVSPAEAKAAVPGALPLARAVAALITAAVVPWLVRRLWPPRGGWAVLGLASLGLAAAASAVHEGLDRGSRLRPGPAEWRAIAVLATETRPLDTVCIEPGSPGVWIPALAGRAVSHPWTPLVYRDESAAITPRPCVQPQPPP